MKWAEFRARLKRKPIDKTTQSLLNELAEIAEIAKPIAQEIERIEEGEAKYPGLYDAYVLDRIGEEATNRKEKRGRSQFSDEDQLAALVEWDRLKGNGADLSEFLARRFGRDYATAYLLVPPQTFHSWRRKFKKLKLYPPPDNS